MDSQQLEIIRLCMSRRKINKDVQHSFIELLQKVEESTGVGVFEKFISIEKNALETSSTFEDLKEEVKMLFGNPDKLSADDRALRIKIHNSEVFRKKWLKEKGLNPDMEIESLLTLASSCGEVTGNS